MTTNIKDSIELAGAREYIRQLMRVRPQGFLLLKESQ